MNSKNTLALVFGALVLVILAAVAGSYITRNAAPAAAPVTEPAPAPVAAVATPVTPTRVTRHEAVVHHGYASSHDDIHWNDSRAAAVPVAQPVAQAAPCNDHNIVGDVAGAAIGGLVGHNFGKGTGKTVATVGGAVGGAVLGNQYIPTQNVACR